MHSRSGATLVRLALTRRLLPGVLSVLAALPLLALRSWLLAQAHPLRGRGTSLQDHGRINEGGQHPRGPAV